MKLLLYTVDPAHGRCLLLAQTLHRVSGITASESVAIAERLFANQHPRANPTTVEVSNSSSADELEAACAEFGIRIETPDPLTVVAAGSIDAAQ